MARARVVHAWYFDSQNAWAVEIDGLEGIVRAGQHAEFRLDDQAAGPYLIRSVEMSDHRLVREAYVALVIQAARKYSFDRFIGGIVETTDPH